MASEMLVDIPMKLRIQPMGCRGWAVRTTAPRTELPMPARLTSGQPWMPVDVVEKGGYDAATSAVSTTPRTRLITAAVQATCPARTSGRLAHGDDDVGAAGLVGADHEVAADRVHPVAQVPQPSGRQDGRHVEASPVVAHSQHDPVAEARELDLDPTGSRVLDRVLHCFDAAEVQRRLELGALPADPAVEDRDRNDAGVHDVAHRSGDALLGEDLRIDAAREVPQARDRVVDGPLLLDQHRVRSSRCSTAQGVSDTEVDHERDQVLLGPVVDVAFQSPPFG